MFAINNCKYEKQGRTLFSLKCSNEDKKRKRQATEKQSKKTGICNFVVK